MDQLSLQVKVSSSCWWTEDEACASDDACKGNLNLFTVHLLGSGGADCSGGKHNPGSESRSLEAGVRTSAAACCCERGNFGLSL